MSARRAVWLTKIPPEPGRSHSEPPPETPPPREQSRLWQALAGDSEMRCRPVPIIPQLAMILTPTKAAILAQLDYWMAHAKYEDQDGKKWVYNTLTEWRLSLPWLGESTIKLAFNEMGVYLDDASNASPKPKSKDGHNLVLIRKFDVSRLRRENFYHLDYSAVARLSARAIAIAEDNDKTREMVKNRRRFSGGVQPLLYERFEVGGMG